MSYNHNNPRHRAHYERLSNYVRQIETSDNPTPVQARHYETIRYAHLRERAAEHAANGYGLHQAVGRAAHEEAHPRQQKAYSPQQTLLGRIGAAFGVHSAQRKYRKATLVNAVKNAQFEARHRRVHGKFA